MADGDDETWVIYGCVLVASAIALGVAVLYAMRHLC